MPFQTPDDWRTTLPLVYETAASLPEQHSYTSLVTDKLATIQNESHFQELLTDSFLFSLYHASVESFQSMHKKPVIPGLDDLENTLIQLMDNHLSPTQNIFINISMDDIKHHLELIDKRMEEALESGDMDECASIAGNIKTMSSLFLYYSSYRYALMGLETQFGTLHNKKDYIEAISIFISDGEFELEEAVQLYHQCVYSRVFLGEQDRLEKLFSKVFDDLITKENINHLLDLTSQNAHQLSDIQTLVMFKQATNSHSNHGYYSQLGLFIKHASNLLLNQTSNPYYLDLFITNMSTSIDFGHDSPLLLSLKKIQLSTDMLKTLLTIPKFNSIMAPYIYNPYFSLSKLNEWISTHTSLLTQCVSALSYLDNMKLYYLYTSEELLNAIQLQRFQLGNIDIAKVNLEAFIPILYFITHNNYLCRKKELLNIFVFAHESYCNIHENIDELATLVHTNLPGNCALFLGIQDVIFGAKLLDTLSIIKKQQPEHLHEAINEIQSALKHKNLSMFERLHKVKNIIEDHLKTQEPHSEGHHILQHILKGIQNLETYKSAVNSPWYFFFKKEPPDIERIMKTIYPTQNGPQLSSSI
jgi:hypothetical protein